MTRYLLAVNFQPGVIDTPMDRWEPAEVQAHLDHYTALNDELRASGELVGGEILAGPDVAKIVTSDGGAPMVTAGPFAEIAEWVAGYQIVEVPSEARALEIAARVSAVPGPGGVPLQQPVVVREIVEDSPSDPETMGSYLEQVRGAQA
ncbi:YciI family protein [Cellulomonas sp. PhB143]|uniref:YciI family protein n=1 Tax=Cellulomonas sp. PhB143 TaxID=2485186 RepID=UPI000F480ADE|nr:YciI family protein [Cellulomonas sp. PhB143]ROS75365.1 hypothetical protein EDF32_1774 [Cellulomonas sp. PhB143]